MFKIFKQYNKLQLYINNYSSQNLMGKGYNNICSRKYKSEVVRIDYEQLINEKCDLEEKIDRAYGKNGLGLIVIKNIPEITKIRQNIFESGFQLAHLNKARLTELERPDAQYYVGWSKGRQYLGDGDDYMQAMFYARIFTDTAIYPKDPELERKFTNIWPEELKNFKENYIKTGKAIANCQINLLKHFDKYLIDKIQTENSKEYKSFLYKNFSINNDATGMMAIYYPPSLFEHKNYNGKSDNWCGWHRDFGLFSGLLNPMFFTQDGKVVNLKTGGLLVKDRMGDINEMQYDDNEIVIQAADALFIFSGGSIISTPHAVKVRDDIPKDLFRLNFITFFEPHLSMKLKPPGDMKLEELIKKDPFKMSNVITKFREGMTYKEFITETFDNFVKK